MQQFHQLLALRTQIRQWREQGLRVGFVPTMGNLHAGHLHLVNVAKQHADKVVVSIFVNPMQFNNTDDLANYPRTLEQDAVQLAEADADALFIPDVATMYPNGMEQQTQVYVPGVSDVLEGEMRPGHFVGVATVVTKLFNLVQPDVACFGTKDYQQLAVLRQMTSDLCLPIEIIGVPTVRAEDGLALSSRNGYLTENERKIAPGLYRVLCDLEQKLKNTAFAEQSKVLTQAQQELDALGFKTDSIDVRDAVTLQERTEDTVQLVVLAAAFLGKARLIDNLVVNLQP